jgi:hypothetical protein
MDPDDDAEDASARAPAREVFWHCKVGLFLARRAPPHFLVKSSTTCTPRFWNELHFEVLRAHTGRHLFLCFFFLLLPTRSAAARKAGTRPTSARTAAARAYKGS